MATHPALLEHLLSRIKQCLIVLIVTAIATCFWFTPVAIADSSLAQTTLTPPSTVDLNHTSDSTSNRTQSSSKDSNSSSTPSSSASPTTNDDPSASKDKLAYDPQNPCAEIGYLPPYYDENLTEAENRGRCTWYLWTGGDETLYRSLALATEGEIDLLKILDTHGSTDSVQRNQRFQRMGVMNDPGCTQADKPDEYGLWLDNCKDPNSTGIIGVRKFKNPNFDATQWDAKKYQQDVEIEPPYRVGLTCAVCHVAFDPRKPPKNPESPTWDNLVATLGNQYLREGSLFAASLKPNNFIWHVVETQEPGTSDTSRIATDHINNPNAINAIFNLGDRPKVEEVMNDGSKKAVHHILKDGADSVGVDLASLRVYVNIGMCSDYWLTLHEALLGRKPQRPFDIETARKDCPGWRATEARMADAEAFLKTQKPYYLKDAPGGKALLTQDEAVLNRGKLAFANSCAQCHSSKQPPAEIAADPEQAKQWYQESVLKADFLDHNFLSDDKRYPVTLVGTNISRALASNAAQGDVWQQFSSKTFKELPKVGQVTLENPIEPSKPIQFNVPGGGRGYYRTPSLASVWATAPLLHNNALGKYTKDPSVEARVAAYTDAMEKLLWTEKRDRIVKRTSQQSLLELPLGIKVPVPKGTPVNLLANINVKTAVKQLLKQDITLADLDPKGGLKAKLTRKLLKVNNSPDFIEDRGHPFGTDLADEDKKAIIEFVKTF